MKNLPYSLIVVKSSEIFQHKKVHHIESKNILSHSNPVAARKGQSLQVRLKAFATNQEALSHPRLERPSQLLLGTCTTKSTGSIGQGSCVGLVCWRRPLLENECPRTPSAFSSIAHSWGMGCHPRKLFSLELVPLRRTGLPKKHVEMSLCGCCVLYLFFVVDFCLLKSMLAFLCLFVSLGPFLEPNPQMALWIINFCTLFSPIKRHASPHVGLLQYNKTHQCQPQKIAWLSNNHHKCHQQIKFAGRNNKNMLEKRNKTAVKKCSYGSSPETGYILFSK